MSTDPGWPTGYDLVELAETESTNAHAARIAGGISRSTWIRADRQTRGRGRSGRPWHSDGANLFATLIYRPDATAQDAALRSFVAANALYDALAKVVDPADLALKWPNDVLYRGGKIAGILLESQSRGMDVEWLAVGIGVNLQTAPPAQEGMAFPPVSLENGPSPAAFLTFLAQAYDAQETIFVDQGFEPIRQIWLSRAARLGETIVARTRNEEITGVFQTVDEGGSLRLDTAQGIRAVSAADVYFG